MKMNMLEKINDIVFVIAEKSVKHADKQDNRRYLPLSHQRYPVSERMLRVSAEALRKP